MMEKRTAHHDPPATGRGNRLSDPRWRGYVQEGRSAMQHTTYLIVGGGMTAAAAVKGIREVDPNGSITLISSEPDPPYKRPPLTKALWKGKSFKKIWIDTGEQDADIRLGRTVEKLDLDAKTATDDRGDSYTFDKLLLATGSHARPLQSGGDRAILYRSVQDYLRLRELTEHHDRFALVGGGFIGSELAASLTSNNKQVTMILTGSGISDNIFPADLVSYLNDYYREKGVEVLTGEEYVGIDKQGNQLKVRSRSVDTHQPREVVVDGVVAGIGTVPNTGLAERAGLEIDNGIVVDEFLRASHPDVYAAGDVAAFWQPELGVRHRFEHEDNANTMGRFAGRAMAGAPGPYQHLPFFYSDLFDLGYEAVGELDARLETVADWKTPFQEGIVYYLRDDVIKGVLLWNVWEKVDAARSLIANQVRLPRNDLAGLLEAAA
jgi:3-phenylpropionate/trans-cinnamate dioxygenase ferredoxin reductase component